MMCGLTLIVAIECTINPEDSLKVSKEKSEKIFGHYNNIDKYEINVYIQ